MTLPANALPNAECSLQNLRKFVADRNITCDPTNAHNHSSENASQNDDEEKRNLIASLVDSDSTMTFRFFGLPVELREHIYALHMRDVTENEPLTKDELFERLRSISPRIEAEARAVFGRSRYPIMSSDEPRRVAELQWEIGRIMRMTLKESRLQRSISVKSPALVGGMSAGKTSTAVNVGCLQ